MFTFFEHVLNKPHEQQVTEKPRPTILLLAVVPMILLYIPNVSTLSSLLLL
jgi:hypothetical protein